MSKLIGWLAWLVVAVMALLTFSGIVTVTTQLVRAMPMPPTAQATLIIVVAFLGLASALCMIVGALSITDRVFNRRPPW